MGDLRNMMVFETQNIQFVFIDILNVWHIWKYNSALKCLLFKGNSEHYYWEVVSVSFEPYFHSIKTNVTTLKIPFTGTHEFKYKFKKSKIRNAVLNFFIQLYAENFVKTFWRQYNLSSL